MNTYLNDKMLVRTIEAHKKIVTEGKTIDLVSIGYEEGTPFERVQTYNAFTILSKLQFSKDEATNPASDSKQYLDQLAAKDLPNKQFIQSLLEYRDKNVNS